MTSDVDKATAKRIVKKYLDNDINDYQLEGQFADALTTVRQEERQRAADMARAFAGRLRRANSHAVAAGVEVLANEILETAANSVKNDEEEGENHATR